MRNIFKLCLIVLCGFLVLTMSSCQFISLDETVEFELPQWPEYLPELEKWSVNLSGLADLPEVAEPVEALPDQKTICFQLPKNRPCCIIARPVIVTQSQFFKSAGTIYPYSKSITWSGGYAANVYNTALDALEQSGYSKTFINEYASSFNWEKLLNTLEEKQQSVFSQIENQEELSPFYNPWLLDTQEVLEGIAYRNFTATKLKLSQAICVELDFDVFSAYVPENDFMRQASLPYVTVKKDVPELFACDSFGILISASSAKNISLEFISMPIYIKEI